MKYARRSMSMPFFDELEVSTDLRTTTPPSKYQASASGSCRKLRGAGVRRRSVKAAPGNESKQKSPTNYILEACKEHHVDVSLKDALNENYFLDLTDEMVTSYDHEVIGAVRSRNLEKLREMHKSGRPLQCCNRFGESIVHLTCRRGYLDVLEFLITEANVSVHVRDDYGRTPMHDACWTAEPNFALMDRLMKVAPEHLLLRDARGHAPLDYARQEHWGSWLKFLKDREEILIRCSSKLQT